MAKLNEIKKMAIASLVLFLPSSAFAHHAMDGETPSTLLEGILSGLAHPVIGPDHLAGIVAVGLLAAALDRGRSLPPVFICTTIVGVLVHVAGVTLPLSEILVASTLFVFGMCLWRIRKVPVTYVVALFAICGLLHGYAYGESIIGSERVPLVGYLLGLAAIQYSIATVCFVIGRRLLQTPYRETLRFASVSILSMAGIAALFATTIG